ncbi:LOW QUALITY PROTEIN: PHD finger protein 7-like [Ammospiza caudacuta]|uniref:LOW QUALITY PROTEIN: PHD finger protein 7-like n=1 Tax=Ammospiza caudacuta TaxID=2857398 RepID=UPI00273842F6|nr:LOW QUALITY PROTEIN: PHD finger protein 7-like [Ammospiza caudacuta]XP_058666978.1 LOW QUALITY PROTEIN: PHD finger protein 7-like [Ammospiza caudacuta]
MQGPRVHVALSWLCPHPTHCLEMQRDHKAPVLTFTGLACSFQTCFICCKMGATITCCQTGCDRTFHLPCAPDGQCVTQYFGAYRSFCWEHRPQQALRPRPSQDNTCTICLDTVEDNISYKTMACPACQDARFHRHCIQRLALHAGIDFRCPRCLKQEPFMTEMLTMGIRLSKRPPSWQSDPEVGPSDQRHGRCDATTCLCPGGREHTEAHGPWQLRLCSSCAAEGIHRLCSSLGNSTCSWECSTCAATDTGRQQSIQHYAIHTGTTMGLAPGPSAQLGSRRALDTTAASPACSLGTVLTTFLLPAPLCRFHWQIRPCGHQNLEHRTADTVPGHGAPQEQLLHQPSAGLKTWRH